MGLSTDSLKSEMNWLSGGRSAFRAPRQGESVRTQFSSHTYKKGSQVWVTSTSSFFWGTVTSILYRTGQTRYCIPSQCHTFRWL